MSLVIKDLSKGRKSLVEGRSYGVGFSLLKKVGDGEYEMYSPISACKDFLNEHIHSEVTGSQAYKYGLTTVKVDLFDNGTYLITQVLPYQHDPSQYHNNVPQEINAELVIQGLNKIEDLLGIEHSTIEFTNEKQTCYNLNPLWSKSYQAISFVSLLVRIFHYYEGQEIKEFNDIKDITKLDADYSMIKGINFNNLTADKLFTYVSVSDYHNDGGIISFIQRGNA